jgi:MFS family permease
MPSLAILVLHASNFQVGLLNTTTQAATPIVALGAGVVLDRIRRQTVLMTANLIMLIAFASIPLVAVLSRLSLAQVFGVSILVGACAVVFDVGYQSYLPSLVSSQDLAEGNIVLEVSNSAARFAGPGLAGLLIQLIGAPGALAANAVSFLASVIGLLRVRNKEPRPTHVPGRITWRQIGAGLGTVLRHPLLRPLTLAAATRNVGNNMARTVLLLFAYRALHLSPGALGLVLSIGAGTSIFGALGARRLVSHIGLGPTLTVSICMEGFCWMLAPLALVGSPALILAVVVGLTGPWLPIWNAQVTTLRQVITPSKQQGRVHAAARSVNWGASPLGALAGGAVASLLVTIFGTLNGLAMTMTVSGAVAATAVFWIMPSAVRHLRDMPAQAVKPSLS